MSGAASFCPSSRAACTAKSLDVGGLRARCPPTAAATPKPLSVSFVAAAVCLHLAFSSAAHAEVRLPPIDTDPNRCERGFTGNTIGQANAVSDKLLDLRGCKFDGKSLAGKSAPSLPSQQLGCSDARLSVERRAYGRRLVPQG